MLVGYAAAFVTVALASSVNRDVAGGKRREPVREYTSVYQQDGLSRPVVRELDLGVVYR